MKATIFFLLLTACSGDVFTGGFEGGVPKDSSDNGDADRDPSDSSDASKPDGEAGAVGDACATQNGQTSCDAVIVTYCQRYTACFGGTVQSCKGDCITSQGINCAETKYANKMICIDSAVACDNFIETTACSNLNTCSRLASACTTYWGQF